MANKVESRTAELDAIVLRDRLYMENPAPDTIENDACKTRMFRRVQIFAELQQLARRH